ncbi:MAG: hypothetical protein ABJH07_00120 [Sedimentitalea sp.]|uniref:hypothetical protein n=1 Tax=Sedimentitalea sp. TaxID=2048915 RepID=UPI003266B410
MFTQPLSKTVQRNLSRWASHLHTADPSRDLSGLIRRTFVRDDPASYAQNMLMPMALPVEPSFSEEQADKMRVTLQPLPPEAPGVDRRDEATATMRDLVSGMAGSEALRWFDRASEPYRGFQHNGGLEYGAFFGTAHDRNGLYTSKVYYETPHGSGAIDGLPRQLIRTAMTALQGVAGLVPLFTTIAARRDLGEQRLTFACTQPLKLADLQPTLDALGLGHRLGSIMQTLGLVLGGRFELPAHSVLLAFGHGSDGPDFEIYVLIGTLEDVPPSFLSLMTMGLSERPRTLRALERWMGAFTPDNQYWPGRFSIISLRTNRVHPPRISLYLRPAEFELAEAEPTAA